jgi:hypothetical protein
MLGTTLDLSTDPVVATDLASSLELILWHIDLASLLGGGIQMGNGSASINITIPSANPASIIVDAAVVHLTEQRDPARHRPPRRVPRDGWHLLVRSRPHSRSTAASRRTLHGSARLAIGVASDGSVDVDRQQRHCHRRPARPEFTGPDGDELDAFITIGNNDFRQLIEGVISAELIPTFTDRSHRCSRRCSARPTNCWTT